MIIHYFTMKNFKFYLIAWIIGYHAYKFPASYAPSFSTVQHPLHRNVSIIARYCGGQPYLKDSYVCHLSRPPLLVAGCIHVLQRGIFDRILSFQMTMIYIFPGSFLHKET